MEEITLRMVFIVKCQCIWHLPIPVSHINDGACGQQSLLLIHLILWLFSAFSLWFISILYLINLIKSLTWNSNAADTALERAPSLRRCGFLICGWFQAALERLRPITACWALRALTPPMLIKSEKPQTTADFLGSTVVGCRLKKPGSVCEKLLG